MRFLAVVIFIRIISGQEIKKKKSLDNKTNSIKTKGFRNLSYMCGKVHFKYTHKTRIRESGMVLETTQEP